MAIPTRVESHDSGVDGLMGRMQSRFAFVVGKGGVGKSTASAALALALADRGARVHLLSTDPAHSLGDLFERRLAPGLPTSVCGPGLMIEEIDTAGRSSAWLESVREPVSDLIDSGTYLDREDVAAFLDRSLPGVDELMGALRLVEISDASAADRVVVDTAPTGHLLRLLDAGDVLDGWSDALDAMARAAPSPNRTTGPPCSPPALSRGSTSPSSRWSTASPQTGVARWPRIDSSSNSSSPTA
jgi:anion-transporting  ArsA/GET3 family ATPase